MNLGHFVSISNGFSSKSFLSILVGARYPILCAPGRVGTTPLGRGGKEHTVAMFDLEQWFELSTDDTVAAWKHFARLRGTHWNAEAYSRQSQEEALEFLRQHLVTALDGKYEPLIIRGGTAPTRFEFLVWRSPLRKWAITRLSPESDQEHVESQIGGYRTREEAALFVLTTFLPRLIQAARQVKMDQQEE